jgi:hypothetical protein
MSERRWQATPRRLIEPALARASFETSVAAYACAGKRATSSGTRVATAADMTFRFTFQDARSMAERHDARSRQIAAENWERAQTDEQRDFLERFKRALETDTFSLKREVKHRREGHR